MQSRLPMTTLTPGIAVPRPHPPQRLIRQWRDPSCQPTGRCLRAFTWTRHLPSGSKTLQCVDDARRARPLLLDFNLSVDAGLPAWKIGGTLPYMAPEELANLVRTKAEPHVHALRSPLGPVLVGRDRLRTPHGQTPFGTIPWDGSLEEIAGQLHQQQAGRAAANPRAERPGRPTFGSAGGKLSGIRTGAPS